MIGCKSLGGNALWWLDAWQRSIIIKRGPEKKTSQNESNDIAYLEDDPSHICKTQ